MGEHPAFAAAESGDVEFFKNLPAEELQALTRKRNEDGRTVVHLAAAAGNREILELLLKSLGGGAKDIIDTSDDEGWTPLIIPTCYAPVRHFMSIIVETILYNHDIITFELHMAS